MQNLISLEITSKVAESSISKKGILENIYKPFKNLQLNTGEITDFRTDKLKFDENNPVDIEIQPSYDGSVNLIMNDDKNQPLLVNSRFSVNEGGTYSITDHSGINDTNLYDEEKVNLDSRLYKTITKIPTIEYVGLEVNGRMKCGTYHFYFKYSDADGNETDFIGESGVVTCHIGGIKDPKTIRMGMMNEDSKKIVKFYLSNLDTQYDYLKVYYTRTTSDNSQQDITSAYVIENKYLIKTDALYVSISGFEVSHEISIDEINPFFELAGTVKTQAKCQNMLFFGNINKPEIPYQELADLSLRITPSISNTENIGNVDYNYIDRSGKNSYEYYNTKNIYSYLGYWPEEYYRFGIVYILNDFTLSPVFNIRGVDLSNNPTITSKDIYELIDNKPTRVFINVDNNGYLTGKNNFENSKGVIKFPKETVIKSDGVYPLAINFNFKIKNSEYDGDVDLITELKKYTRGFFFVRQERIPTILAQGCTIGKTKNEYGNLPVLPVGLTKTATIQGFLDNDRLLNKKNISIDSTKFENKALIVPEASIREPLFNQLFTSNKYQITFPKEQSTNKIELASYSDPEHYFLNRNNIIDSSDNKFCTLTIVNDSLKLTTNGKDYFSAKAGEAEQAWEIVDVTNDWESVDSSIINKASSFVRGNFGTYIGVGDAVLSEGDIINIRPENYIDDINYKTNAFKVRFESVTSFLSISDRLSWDKIVNNQIACYRGDCYIGNFTHRMQRNFIDPELPTNDKIIDSSTWKKNFYVKTDTTIGVSPNKKYLNRILFNYKIKDGNIKEPEDASYDSTGTLISGSGSTIETDWKTKGAHKINRADVNAVPIGNWFTFKVMSNVNISMRDIDLMNPTEQSIFGKPRGFFPLNRLSTAGDNKLPDSNIINGAANVTLSKRYNFLLPDVPFLKNKFDTRILYSNIHITDAFTNGFRVFRGGNYRDYPKTYGALVSMHELNGNIVTVMENGVLLIPVNERALAGEGAGGTVYINTSNILPENPRVLSNTFGSIWKDSVIMSVNTIYGVDTIAKKIWKTDGESFEIISDLKVQQYLNNNINLNEADKTPTIGIKNVKSHYNAFKGDIMFTFYNEDKEWNLCYNEKLGKFITRYSWTPVMSENINNIFFSFDKEDIIKIKEQNTADTTNYPEVNIWKHGQAGVYDAQETIKPTKWYNTIEPFEFEFVMANAAITQKIFDNLKIISNKAKPSDFEFEIVGEGYDWFEVKDTIVELNERVPSTYSTLEDSYKAYLIANRNVKKLPFIKRIRRTTGNIQWEDNTTDIKLVKDDLLNEDRVHIQQLANDIKVHGRLRGNIQYLEDLWNVEIRPVNFKYAYLDLTDTLQFTTLKQSRLRDKYLKVRVKYSGNDLAIVQAIKTIYTISYA